MQLSDTAIFLDLDGVLVTHRSHAGHGKCGGLMEDFDPMACRMLLRIINATGAKIVISSTWRYIEGVPLFEQLKKNNLFEHLHEDWRTPYVRDFKTRGEEIKAWLDKHPEIEHYVIIDDDSDILEEQKPFFVKCDGLEGFLFRDFWKIKKEILKFEEE